MWVGPGEGDHTGGGAGLPSGLTVPLFEAVLPNCYLVLGLKQRTPSHGLSAAFPPHPHPGVTHPWWAPRCPERPQ